MDLVLLMEQLMHNHSNHGYDLDSGYGTFERKTFETLDEIDQSDQLSTTLTKN